MSQLFASGGQSIEASVAASVFPMNIQNWFPLGLTSLFSLQSKGLSRVFSISTVQKHQFFSTQPSLWSNSHMLFNMLSWSVILFLQRSNHFIHTHTHTHTHTHVYIGNWITLLYTWNYQNIVNELHFNFKKIHLGCLQLNSKFKTKFYIIVHGTSTLIFQRLCLCVFIYFRNHWLQCFPSLVKGDNVTLHDE